MLPRLGRLKLHESARKLARRLEAGTARIMSATVRRDGGRWYVSFTVRSTAPTAPRPGPARWSVSTSGSNTSRCCPPARLVDEPAPPGSARPAAAARWAGPVAQDRPGPAHRPRRRTGGERASSPARPGARPGREPAPRRPAQAHHPAGRAPTARSWSKTSTWPGCSRNRRLARHIADAGFAEIRRQLAYKTAWNGGRLLVADRWYPSSKTCSGCGAVKTKLRPVRA